MGGDHKCPLCSATFTRPQHVGRHLRAHTGDRPYECKECPLRFARSDLLSRHVNKAHKPPDENAAQDKKQNKKGRRKSFPASAMKQPSGNPQINGDNSGSNNTNQVREKPRSASFNQQPQPQLQAQRMYPHHPLLAGGSNENGIIDVQPQHQTWSANPSQAFATTAGMTNLSSSPYAQTFVNPVTGTGNPNAILGLPPYPNSSNDNLLPTFDPPFTAAPMKITGSEQGYSSIGQVPMNNNSGVLYEWGFKKRACDQCNHSKVRCDFADPCLRCTHRNIKCSYNKPQRSRTIGYPLVPSQASTSSQAGLNYHHQANNAVSTSPQSQFSSPHSNSSPVAPARAVNHHQRNNSVSSLPGNLSAPASTIPPRQWGSVSHIQPAGTLNNWQPVQSNLAQPMYPNIPAGTAPGSITGQIIPSPVSTNLPMQGATAYQAPTLYPGTTNAGSRGASPQQGAASTPSLTNNTTSPPDIDEPFERRSSYTGTTGGFLSGQEWQDQNQQFKAPTLQTHNSDPAYIVPFNSSPVTYSPTQTSQLSSSAPFSSNSTYQWPSQSSQTVDPTWQARHGTVSEDENASALSSSTHSTFLNLDDAQFAPSQHQQHRRRSSASQWTSALAQMSLQDPLSSTESSIIPLPEPFSGSGSMDSSLSMSMSSDGSMPTQQTAVRRPTFPTLTGVTEEPDAETQLMPSLSDVKDLWRLFMTEPMTGLTPMGEKHNDLEFTTNNAPLITPRPGMGKRTLSKSNSMPDLQSPMINGPQFFNTFLSGLTPKPVDSQNSYLPNHQPAGNNGNASGNDADISKWSKEIQQRQSSFSLSGQPSTKLMGKTTSQSSMAPPPTASNGGKPKMNRPLPSVVQRSSALEQTLAPERIPSFGIPQSLLDGNNQFVPQTQTQKKMLSGVPPHMARPGNKRLASQTLVPGDNGKKTTFTLYDEPDQVQLPHPTQTQAQAPTQTQNSSMFYPNWSLNPQQAGK